MRSVFITTGFACVEHTSPDFHLMWYLRMVNQRFLETTFRVPKALRGIEQSLRERARRALTRDRLDASLKLEANGADHIFTESESLLDALLAAATAI